MKRFLMFSHMYMTHVSFRFSPYLVSFGGVPSISPCGMVWDETEKGTKACTHWKSNPGPQSWSTTALTTKQILLDNHQPTQSSIYTDPVVLNAVVSNLAATGYQGLLGVDWKLDLLSISPHMIEHVLQMRWGTLQCKKVYILVTSLAFLLCVWHVEFKECFQFERA